MGNFSRDSFHDTKNALNELLGLVPSGAPGVRNYVSVRLQQAVPVVDADWNEGDDIRRRELELLLLRSIGNGVPASSDGFRVSANSLPNNFAINAGILFNNGWLVYNRTTVNYDAQPYQNANGVAPPLPVPLQPPAAPTLSLVYLDAWETEVNSQQDGSLIDTRIGVATAVRLERAWVVRIAALAAGANPLDPASIPSQQAGHRYYPLATVNQPASSQISDGMISDLRRLQLTLDAVTHAPLSMYDPVRDQRLDSARLALAFKGNLDALIGILNTTPEVFVYSGHPIQTAQALQALQDVRASATSFQQQAQAVALYQQAAMTAMQTFFNIESALLTAIAKFQTAGLATGFAATFVSICTQDLNGSSATDPTSMSFALSKGDLIGAVLAQERLNQDLGNQTSSLPDGSVGLSFISVTPTTAVVAGTPYQLTVRVASFLTSSAGTEQIDVQAATGTGWSLAFQGNPVNVQTPNLAEVVVQVTNQKTQDIVLTIIATGGAANTSLNLTARPVRRQQLVYQNPPSPLAIGQPVLAGSAPIVTLTYQGPTLQPGNIAVVARSAMFGGIAISFGVASLSTNTETFQITVTAQGAPTGWIAPAQPVLAPLGPGLTRSVNITFQTSDQLNASSPAIFQLELVRVTGGANDPQPNTIFNLTFQLTAG